MGRITVLGGDIPTGSEFYNNPGSIGGLPVARLDIADSNAVKKLGVAKPFGFGRKVYFLATMSDGRRALAATDQRTYGHLERDISGGPVPAEAVADRKKENTRTGIIFMVVYFVSLYFSARYLSGYLPFLVAFAVGAVVTLAWNVFFARLRR